MSNIIVLMTDFGYKDPYVSLMKSVIYKINPKVKIIDLTHDIPSFNVHYASYILLVSYKYFPRGTIFVVVVDPGVGGNRKALIIKTRNYLFVGPDNGVLYPAANDDGIVDIINVVNDKFFIKPTSNTFHGRDIFAPVAAYLSLGIDHKVFGNNIAVKDIIKHEISIREFNGTDKTICGQVIYIDKFGNIVLNIKYPQYDLYKFFTEARISVNNRDFKVKVGKSFSSVNRGEFVLYVNSFNLMELGINMGNAAKTLNVKVGDSICIELNS